MTNQLSQSLKLIALVLVSSCFFQCARNPVTGKKQLSFMTKSQEKALGLESDPQILAEYGLYPDSNLQKYITDIGGKMVKVSHLSNSEFKFRVVDSDVVNAFAVPGGYVYFTRGILAHFNNEAQLAGVLGHEIGHVTARHGAQQMTQQTLGQIALVGAMIASPTLMQYGNELSQGMQLLFLKNGRDHETQSDELGVEYSSKIGFDAREMAGFFKTLDRLSGGQEGRLPDFLSTHPNPIDRYGKVRTNAGRFQHKKPGEYTINREGYLRLIDGIVYGPDPRQGFVENQMFYHPELKFQFPVPLSWKYVNSPQQFQMGSPDQKALMILTLAQEKSLAEAARNFAEKNKLRQMDIRNTTINGLQAIIQLCDQVPQQQQQQGQPQQQQGQAQAPLVRIVTGFIMHDNLIYKLHGVAELKDFANYDPIFSSVIKGFNVLTDPTRLAAKPEKIRIKTVQQTATFKDVMIGMGLPEKRLNELSIVNGMLPTDQVLAGSLVKMVEK